MPVVASVLNALIFQKQSVNPVAMECMQILLQAFFGLLLCVDTKALKQILVFLQRGRRPSAVK